uniref:Uncharacterized protein n=1 Tax=Romanomermis culicivorax TaxID=13658 RepID=A0A915IGD5_ROMCU
MEKSSSPPRPQKNCPRTITNIINNDVKIRENEVENCLLTAYKVCCNNIVPHFDT